MAKRFSSSFFIIPLMKIYIINRNQSDAVLWYYYWDVFKSWIMINPSPLRLHYLETSWLLLKINTKMYKKYHLNWIGLRTRSWKMILKATCCALIFRYSKTDQKQNHWRLSVCKKVYKAIFIAMGVQRTTTTTFKHRQNMEQLSTNKKHLSTFICNQSQS